MQLVLVGKAHEFLHKKHKLRLVQQGHNSWAGVISLADLRVEDFVDEMFAVF